MGSCRTPRLVYDVKGPKGTKFEKTKLRIIAYHPESYPEPEKLKVVLQSFEGRLPIAEDPISVDYLSRQALDTYIEECILEGWEISLKKDSMDQTERKRKDCERFARNRKARKASAPPTGSDP